MEVSVQEALYKLYHVFLPPKLPHQDDSNPTYSRALLTTVINCLSSFRDYVEEPQRLVISSALEAMRRASIVHDAGGDTLVIAEMGLQAVFKQLSSDGGSLPVFVNAQNAGILITRQEEKIIFEAFEVSPRNQDVMATRGRLKRTFPGCGVSLALSVFESVEFRDAIAFTLSRMSFESVPGMQPEVRKAKQMHAESRDTTNPKVVTEYLMTFLAAHEGARCNTMVISKNTREEVLWENSELPWRRSPFWLFLRVSLQMMFCRLSHQPEDPDGLYKDFMLFLIASVSKECHGHLIEADYLSAMNGKLNRRLLKLEPSNEALRHFVHNAMSKTNRFLERRWSEVQRASSRTLDLSTLKNLDFEKDSKVGIPVLDDFIASLSARKCIESVNHFKPSQPTNKNEQHELPTLPHTNGNEEMARNLMEVEMWVATSLKSWLQPRKREDSTTQRLRTLIESYYSKAIDVYTGNPELTSIMVLTILDLWMACDISTTELCPLLRDYDPGLPVQLLQNLILPLRNQLKRLHAFEKYMTERQKLCKLKCDDIFVNFGSIKSFGVRYYDQSSQHRELMERILIHAEHERQKKREEFARLKAQYEDLMRQHQGLQCQYYTYFDEEEDISQERHHYRCTKCDLKKQASKLKIFVHEWPLSSDDGQAKATVFELDVPLSFCHWRDVTAFTILEVFKAEYASVEKSQSQYKLHTYAALAEFMVSFDSYRRVELLSECKPNTVTHRKMKQVSTSQERDVCLNNGLHFSFFDGSMQCFTRAFHQTDRLPRICTYSLPGIASMDKFLFRPHERPSGPSPNTVLAALHECPTNMSIEEYKALCSIPLGHNIQWQNILAQLYAMIVDFKKTETEIVLLQCIGQVGPPRDTVLRSNHSILDNCVFVEKLIDGISEVSNNLKENWQAASAFGAFISLVLHLLSVCRQTHLRQKCLDVLALSRCATLQWTIQLKERVLNESSSDRRDYFRAKAAATALICVNTFDMDADLQVELFQSTDAASIFFQCCIVLQENKPLIVQEKCSTVEEYSIVLRYARWKRLCQKASSILANEIVNQSNTALDDAITASWQAYQGSGRWRQFSIEHSNWLVKDLPQTRNAKSAQVQYDLYTGELLVNGIPLNQLPKEFQQHPMYRKLFGSSIIEVMPSNVPGMQFSSKKLHVGHVLHFGLDISNLEQAELLVQAHKDGFEFELVPSWAFRHHFPKPFVESRIQWLNKALNHVEFRSLNEPWKQSDTEILLSHVSESKWRLQVHHQYVLGIESPTAKILSGIFSSVEVPAWTVIATSPTFQLLDIGLPRLQVAFKLNHGELQIVSKEFPYMQLDENQELGALFGLRNKVVLRNRAATKRLILIPDGNTSFTRRTDHTEVSIDPESVTKSHSYHVDVQLGRLVDNGTAHSKVFLAYLYALTSFCLPDPLTGRSGTESALSILDSAALKSFTVWSKKELDILRDLSALTPSRAYYPRGETCMQTVGWSSKMGFLAQHGAFYRLVQSIFDRSNRSKFFYADSWIAPRPSQHVDLRLLDRDDIRSSSFRVSEYGSESFTSHYDVAYDSRDLWRESKQVQDVFAITRAIFRESVGPYHVFPADMAAWLWDQLSAIEIEIRGEQHHQDLENQLTYAAQWLTDTSFLRENWLVLHRALSEDVSFIRKTGFAFWLSAMAYGGKMQPGLLHLVAGFAFRPELRCIERPQADRFVLHHGTAPIESDIFWEIVPRLLPIEDTPEHSLPRLPKEANGPFKRRKEELYKKKQEKAVDMFVKAMIAQWPCASLQTPPKLGEFKAPYTYINMPEAMTLVNFQCERWYNNRCFREYLGRIDRNVHWDTASFSIADLSLAKKPATKKRKQAFLSSKAIFSHNAPQNPGTEDSTSHRCFVLKQLLRPRPSTEGADFRLDTLLQTLRQRASSSSEKKYTEQLQHSFEALKDHRQRTALNSIAHDDLLSNLDQLHARCTQQVAALYCAILQAIYGISFHPSKSIRSEDIPVPNIYQWPRVCPTFILSHLCKKRWHALSPDWQRCLIQYGISVTHLHQANRLLALTSTTGARLVQELENIGHTNWNPQKDPESLLFEVEGDFMIREVQAQIASEMRCPSSGSNAVMQLNMGEGKSSVIVPMVAASLANESLARVIAAKPQARQMFEMLLSRFGGLVDRPIFQAPFSRSIKTGPAEAMAIHDIYQECAEQGGILLVQPEHILSFKLMGVERGYAGEDETCRLLLRSQKLLFDQCRDIVDESDENFSPKFELIYTAGTQQPIDHSPTRWCCVQEIFDILRDYLPAVKKQFPDSIETLQDVQGSFPRTRILRSDAGEAITNHIVDTICDVGLSGFPLAGKSKAYKNAIREYVTIKNLTKDQIEAAEQQREWTEAEMKTLLLLRGLFAGGVLGFAFSRKRWRVNYGLARDRIPATKLAVPYRAKDIPSPRSEFSHPDVVILLTLLTYYYGGLDDNELMLAFHHLQNSDQANSTYQEWVKDAHALPSTFSRLDGVNLDDVNCKHGVFPCLRKAKSVVDYYVAHVVFPKEMREFPYKLSASGWDLGEVKCHVTTGFSGTNDSRIVLPLSMEQLDLSSQKHTNALVLEHLLQPENNVAPILASRKEGESDADKILHMVVNMEQKTRVILDVGAQIIELNNKQVAERWLKLLPDNNETQAAVFFDDDDNICVLDRKGIVDLLQISPFATRLDVCLIFLDEAHTRGTDLKLPQDYRAAVTLGAGLTKDRLVQACMRMRQLGKGQSVVFCVPEEISHKIRALNPDKTQTQVYVSDVLAWSISETWTDVKRCMALWAVQGKRFQRQQRVWALHHDQHGETLQKEVAEMFLEPEAQTLKERYRPAAMPSSSVLTETATKAVDEIDRRSREFLTEGQEANLQQEAERELSPEAEEEKSVEKPLPAEPLPHGLHNDVVKFVKSGEIVSKSKAYMPAFRSLSCTSAAIRQGSDVLDCKSVLVTTDFAETVVAESKNDLRDSYQRQVQWILSRRSQGPEGSAIDLMLIISPFEAQNILATVSNSKRVALHIYAPRSNLGLRPLDSMDLFTMPDLGQSHIPQDLITRLNIFAGQLYFKSWDQYMSTCNFLGITHVENGPDERHEWRSEAGASLRDSVHVLMRRIRRNLEDISRTHVGAILDGRKLRCRDLE